MLSLRSDLGGRPAWLVEANGASSPAIPRQLQLLLAGTSWAGALQLLPRRERETVKEHILPTADDIDSTLRDAFYATQDKQQLCEDKRWTFTFGGHTVRLRSEADTVMLWLDRFKPVENIAVNADPIHVGLPWAGVRLLLEVQKDSDYLFVTL